MRWLLDCSRRSGKLQRSCIQLYLWCWATPHRLYAWCRWVCVCCKNERGSESRFQFIRQVEKMTLWCQCCLFSVVTLLTLSLACYIYSAICKVTARVISKHTSTEERNLGFSKLIYTWITTQSNKYQWTIFQYK